MKNNKLKNLFFIVIIVITVTVFSCNSNPKDHTSENKTSTAADSSQFNTYCNARFNYCVDYPADLIPQPESTNGDGRVFKNKMNEDVLTVFGTNNLDTDNKNALEKLYNDDLHRTNEFDTSRDRVITYQKLGETFYVLSGRKKDKIFYQKTIMKNEIFASAILEYSDAEKNIFDKVSEKIFNSFK